MKLINKSVGLFGLLLILRYYGFWTLIILKGKIERRMMARGTQITIKNKKVKKTATPFQHEANCVSFAKNEHFT